MAHIGALRHEYEKRLKVKPGLQGKITVQFTISAPGKVIECKVISSTINDATLEAAITKRIRRWQFDKIKKNNVTVVYPFAFSPDS